MRLQQFLLLTTLVFSSFTLFSSQTQSLLSDSQAQASEQESSTGAAAPRRHSPQNKRSNSWSKKIGQTALACTSLAVLGLLHGATNNYLSKGAHNEHFFKAPLREWLVGLGFSALQMVLARSGKIPGRLYINNQYLHILTFFATRGGGQALGEMIPLNGHSRNFAVNQWSVGIPFLLSYAWHVIG